MIRVLMVCHGNILGSPGKAGKINAFMKPSSTYNITATPFTDVP